MDRMADKLEELPLFPLDTVLFPYGTMQIRITNPLHRQIIRRCLEFEQGFGIVLTRTKPDGEAEDPYMVGTAVRIEQVDELEDGSLDVRVQGERRFRIRKLDYSREFLTGFVEPVVELEVEDNPRTDALVMRARESFSMLIEGVLARPNYNIQVVFPSDPTALSFVIANFLPLENLEKQRLLETTDTQGRLADLIPLIEQQIVTARPRVYRLGAEHLKEWINRN